MLRLGLAAENAPHPKRIASIIFSGFYEGIDMKKRLVHGVGVNDADYRIAPTIVVNGVRKQDRCPFYFRWKSMLERCYNKKTVKKHPTYEGCKVCGDWLLFSNFKRWMENQDWEGNELDKDILSGPSKIYSPETCVFIPSSINRFLNDHGRARGDLPIGVAMHSDGVYYCASCSNPDTGIKEYIGIFKCPQEAHEAWKAKKIEYAKKLCGELQDERILKSILAKIK